MQAKPLAWEQPGWSPRALWETALKVITDPSGAISAPMGPEVPLKPFVFAGVASVVSAMGAWVVGLMVTGGMGAKASFGVHLLSGLVSWGIFLPILAWILSQLLARLFHATPSDFTSCLRTLGYSYVTSLAGIIPFVGGIAALVWWFWMLMQMLPAFNGLTRKQAFGAACLLVLATLILAVVMSSILIGIFVGSMPGQ